MDANGLSNVYERVVGTFGFNMNELEACLKVKNSKQMTDKALVSAIQSRFIDANNTMESKRQAECTMAESKIAEKSTILAEENGFLRDQNFKLMQQLTRNKDESGKLRLELAKTEARLNQMDSRRGNLFQELRYLTAMKQTCIIAKKPIKTSNIPGLATKQRT